MNLLGSKSLNDEIVVNNLYTPGRVRLFRLREHLFVLKEFNFRSSFLPPGPVFTFVSSDGNYTGGSPATAA